MYMIGTPGICDDAMKRYGKISRAGGRLEYGQANTIIKYLSNPSLQVSIACRYKIAFVLFKNEREISNPVAYSHIFSSLVSVDEIGKQGNDSMSYARVFMPF